MRALEYGEQEWMLINDTRNDERSNNKRVNVRDTQNKCLGHIGIMHFPLTASCGAAKA